MQIPFRKVEHKSVFVGQNVKRSYLFPCPFHFPLNSLPTEMSKVTFLVLKFGAKNNEAACPSLLIQAGVCRLDFPGTGGSLELESKFSETQTIGT